MFYDCYFPDYFYYPDYYEAHDLEMMNLYFEDVYMETKEILEECYFAPEKTWDNRSIQIRFIQRAVIKELINRMETDCGIAKDPILLIINFIEELEDYANELEENNADAKHVYRIKKCQETLEDLLCNLSWEFETMY